MASMAGVNYQLWIERHELTLEDLAQQRCRTFTYAPKISVITPVYNTPQQYLIDMIESVKQQTYSNWELCLVDGNSTDPHITAIMEAYAHKDQRIKSSVFTEKSGHCRQFE